MGDFSRSQFWDELDEAPEENWKQSYMEDAIRRYLSRPESPHPPCSPTPDDDPVHQHFFHPLPPHRRPQHYHQSYLDSMMYARRVGQRNSEDISQFFSKSNSFDYSAYKCACNQFSLVSSNLIHSSTRCI